MTAGPRFGADAPLQTVVLLHSSASSPRQWDALATALAPRHRVHAVALLGHGDRPAAPGMPQSLADDAAVVLPHLAAANGAHLVGHSYGGAIALHMATMYPAAIRSVAVYEPVLFPLLREAGVQTDEAASVAAVAATIRAALQRADRAAAAQCFVDFWSGGGTWASLRADRRHAIAERMPVVLRHFDALYREAPGTAALARLAMPMLFLSGGSTVPATRRIAALLRVALPAAVHAVLPGMGHMGPVTHADRVNARIADFLDGRGARDVTRAYARCA